MCMYDDLAGLFVVRYVLEHALCDKHTQVDKRCFENMKGCGAFKEKIEKSEFTLRD